MFPLHVLRCPDCIYLCFLDASSLSELGFTVTSKSSGAPDEEEDTVTKGRLTILVGDFVEEDLGEIKEKLQI